MQQGAPGTFVYVVNANNTVSVRTVKVGATDGELSGGRVRPGGRRRVVTDGTDRLRDGAEVTIPPPESRPRRRRARQPGAAEPAAGNAGGATGGGQRRGPAAGSDATRGGTPRRVPHAGTPTSGAEPAQAGQQRQPPQAGSASTSRPAAPVRRSDSRPAAMNPSRLFILRPVGTTLLMVAILLVGIVAYRFLPISALPEVDYPTIQVQTFYPGASPEVMTSSVTAPLEVQFGQMPSLNQMFSTSSAGASVITLQFGLDLSLDVAEQEVQAAINAAGNLLPSDLPAPPIYAKVNPADAPILTLALTSKTMPLTAGRGHRRNAGWRRRSRSSPASGWSASAAASVRRCACRSIPRALAAYGLNIDDLRTTLGNANVNTPKGDFDGPTQADHDQRQRPDHRAPRSTLDLVIAYRNGAPVRLRDVATVVQRGGEHQARRLGQHDAGDHPERPAPARRQRHQRGRHHQGAAAAIAGRRCRRRWTSRC